MSSIMEGWTGKRAMANQEQSLSTGPASANMANDVLIQPDSETKDDLPSTEGHELDAFLGKALKRSRSGQISTRTFTTSFFRPSFHRWS